MSAITQDTMDAIRKALHAETLSIEFGAFVGTAPRFVAAPPRNRCARHTLKRAKHGNLSIRKVKIVFGPAMRRITCGAQICAARRLHRLTHERPGADSPSADPTQRWCSDCGKVRANVTGNSARTVGLHPSLALGLTCTEAADSRRRRPTSHPAAAMERPT